MENENVETHTSFQWAVSALAVGVLVYVPTWAGHSLVAYGVPLSIIGYVLYLITLLAVIASFQTIFRPQPLWSKVAHTAMLGYSGLSALSLVI